jgi:hypothetical protein
LRHFLSFPAKSPAQALAAAPLRLDAMRSRCEFATARRLIWPIPFFPHIFLSGTVLSGKGWRNKFGRPRNHAYGSN